MSKYFMKKLLDFAPHIPLGLSIGFLSRFNAKKICLTGVNLQAD